jgi:hypothetical protein
VFDSATSSALARTYAPFCMAKSHREKLCAVAGSFLVKHARFASRAAFYASIMHSRNLRVLDDTIVEHSFVIQRSNDESTACSNVRLAR